MPPPCHPACSRLQGFPNLGPAWFSLSPCALSLLNSVFKQTHYYYNQNKHHLKGLSLASPGPSQGPEPVLGHRRQVGTPRSVREQEAERKALRTGERMGPRLPGRLVRPSAARRVPAVPRGWVPLLTLFSEEETEAQSSRTASPWTHGSKWHLDAGPNLPNPALVTL